MITSKEIIDRIDEIKEAKNLFDYRVTKTANVKQDTISKIRKRRGSHTQVFYIGQLFRKR